MVRTYIILRELARAVNPMYPELMEQIINIIGPTVFAVALGYLFGKVARASTSVLIDVSMFIATPCLVFGSMYSSTINMGEAVKLWASCVLIMGGTFIMAWLAFGLFGKRRSGLYLPIIFSNTINIPLPIIYLAFGNEGVAKVMLFYIPNGLLVYSLGIYLASGQKGLKKGLKAILRTPLIYAAVLGLVLNLAGAHLPGVVTTSLEFMGQAAVPLILIVLGMTIGHIRLTQFPLTLTASVIRMGGGFAVGLLAVWLLGLTGLPRAVVLFEAAMPSAVAVSVLCTKYNNEAELVSSIVLTTTLMSVAVIPALLYYLT